MCVCVRVYVCVEEDTPQREGENWLRKLLMNANTMSGIHHSIMHGMSVRAFNCVLYFKNFNKV